MCREAERQGERERARGREGERAGGEELRICIAVMLLSALQRHHGETVAVTAALSRWACFQYSNLTYGTWRRITLQHCAELEGNIAQSGGP